MELIDFLRQTRARVIDQVGERMSQPETGYPYEESVFTEIVMEHLEDIGMTFGPEVCHLDSRIGNARLRLSGYSFSEDGERADLFVSIYEGTDELTPIPDARTKDAAAQCMRFLARCADGRLLKTIEEANPAFELVSLLNEAYPKLGEIRIYVITDCVTKSKRFAPQEEGQKTIKLEVMDIERLFRHWSEGKPREDITIDFRTLAGGPVPCIYVPGEATGCDYALTVIPGEALRHIYEKFGPRLLEANVRSFLMSAKGKENKVNSGIRKTILDSPEQFIAFNNGIVIIVDSLELGRMEDGSQGILGMEGIQIVNGGQTTASLYFTKKKNPSADLSRVRVPAKIVVMNSMQPAQEELLVSQISRFANSQTAVKVSDLSANRPFHVEMEKLADTIFCADGESRWYYERTAGSYNVLLVKAGERAAKLKHLQKTIPTKRKITKPELAKYLNTWDGRPHIVNLGSQKNFERYMADLETREEDGKPTIPDAAEFKRMIAKAIVYLRAYAAIKPMFRADQAQVTTFTVALLADRLGSRIRLDQIWQNQDVSSGLLAQIKTWANEVNAVLEATREGRSVSEWAKKPECWETVRTAALSEPSGAIPEAAEPVGCL
jgi:hypothetical protein